MSAAALRALVAGDLAGWTGLTELGTAELDAAYGAPGAVEEVRLGWHPAERRDHGVLAAYARAGRVVMVEALTEPPPLAALDALGEPDAVLPHELREPGAYVHEHLHCGRGLLVSVAEPHAEGEPARIVRVRGIHPLASPRDLGPDLYLSLDDAVGWSPP